MQILSTSLPELSKSSGSNKATQDNNKLLVKEDASSRKLKTQQKMISIIKKNSSSQKAAEFQTAIANAKNLTEKKRVYFSDYGFANSREVIRGDEDILVKNPINFDKFYQENLIKNSGIDGNVTKICKLVKPRLMCGRAFRLRSRQWEIFGSWLLNQSGVWVVVNWM